MRLKFTNFFMTAVVAFGFLVAELAVAQDAESKTSSAVTNILFEYDADEFASYVIRENGWLDITFASNTPDALYSEILNKLQNNPNIKGVLSGKTGPTCSRF